jgi:hypothetical protein
MNTLALTTLVLRDPDALAESADRNSLARLAPPLLALTIGGAAMLGVAAGASSSPLQSLFAATKLPLLFLAPPLVALPLVHAFADACDVPVPWSRLGVATLSGLARTGLLAAAAAPLLWLPLSLGAEYHLSVLAFVVAFGLVTLPALATLARAVPLGGRQRFMAVVGSLVALGLLTAQTGWVLRPFVARPTVAVTFLRPVESDVFSALGANTRSAAGDYRTDWDARRSGVFRERGE